MTRAKRSRKSNTKYSRDSFAHTVGSDDSSDDDMLQQQAVDEDAASEEEEDEQPVKKRVRKKASGIAIHLKRIPTLHTSALQGVLGDPLDVTWIDVPTFEEV